MPMPASAHRPGGRTPYARAREFVRPFRRSVAAIIGLALLIAAANATEPLIMRELFDELGGSAGFRPIAIAVALLLTLELGRAAITAWMSTITWDVRLGLDLLVRERVVRKLTRLPLSYHQNASVGGTMTTINQALSGFIDGFSEVAFKLLPTLVYFALSLFAMWHLDPRLCVVVLLFVPLPALVGALASREQTERQRRLLAQWTRVYSRLNEVLAGIRAVKIFAMEEEETRRFLSGQREGNEIVRRGVRTDARTEAMRGMAAALARLAAIAVGGMLLVRGELTLGTLVAFLGYISGLFGPVQGLTTIYQTLRKARVGIEAIYGILDQDEVVGDAPGARAVGPLRGEVRFRDVSFGYHPAAPVLSNVSLDVQPGEVIALVGPSGSGKTTLVSLLQRLYPPTGGSILVDNVDIRDLSRQSLARQIGVVFQDSYLFQDTVRANIAYARPEATQEEIETAARAAHAHDFIMSLPHGYDTPVGERGSCLSGGQRQRVAIARALLIDPPILILDEATSALDAESEALVQEALAALIRGRTTFVIAHRLTTVVDADRIVVMRDGMISEIGTHHSLVRDGGYYATLVGKQTRGLILAAA